MGSFKIIALRTPQHIKDEQFKFAEARLALSNGGTCGVQFWTIGDDEIVSKPLTSDGDIAKEVVAGHVYAHFFNTPHYRLATRQSVQDLSHALCNAADRYPNLSSPHHIDDQFSGNIMNLKTIRRTLKISLENKQGVAIVFMNNLDCVNLEEASAADLVAIFKHPSCVKSAGRLMGADGTGVNIDRYGWIRWISRQPDEFGPDRTNLGNFVFLSPSKTDGPPEMYVIDTALNDTLEPAETSERMAALIRLLTGKPPKCSLDSKECAALRQKVIGQLAQTEWGLAAIQTNDGARFFAEFSRALGRHLDNSLLQHFKAHPQLISELLTPADLELDGEALTSRCTELMGELASSIMFGNFLRVTTQLHPPGTASQDTPENRDLLKQGFLEGLHEFCEIMTPQLILDELAKVQLQLPEIRGAAAVTQFATEILPHHIDTIRRALEA